MLVNVSISMEDILFHSPIHSFSHKNHIVHYGINQTEKPISALTLNMCTIRARAFRLIVCFIIEIDLPSFVTV